MGVALLSPRPTTSHLMKNPANSVSPSDVNDLLMLTMLVKGRVWKIFHSPSWSLRRCFILANGRDNFTRSDGR